MAGCELLSSDTWEYWYPKREGEVEPEVPKLAEMLARESRLRVLDFGCGTGRHSLHLARRGFQVYGFDGYEKAVKRARQLLKHAGLKAELEVRDMLKPLPYPDQSFDLVIATRVIHHTLKENIRRIAAEIDRVLRNRGYLFVQVPEHGDHEWVLREAPSTHRVLEPGTHIPLEGVEKGVPHHHFTREELLGLFPNYEPSEIHMGSDHYRGFCLLAEKVAQ